MNNSAGKIRRSFAVSTFAPGAIVDLRGEGGAPLSAVMAGLECWEEEKADKRIWMIFEPRLQRKLKVKRFQLPPVSDDDDASYAKHPLLGVRFPTWLQCPGCSELREANGWSSDLGKAGLYCQRCTANATGNKKKWVIPVRFVVACARGHLDEFPWHWWVKHKMQCTQKAPLKLEARAAGLAGLHLLCTGCAAERSMDGIFSKDGLKGICCAGRRPWLRSKPEECGEAVRVLQRGASNLHFPIIESALTIPPFSERITEQLGYYWDSIRSCTPADRLDHVNRLWPSMDTQGITLEQVLAVAAAFDLALSAAPEDGDLRTDEYPVLNSSQKYSRRGEEFALLPDSPPQRIAGHFARVSRVTRLREVRAVRAFTRITPPTGDFRLDGIKAAFLSRAPKDWLPAIEVRGEGIFTSLDMRRLSEWERRPAVMRRVKRMDDAHREHFIGRFGEDSMSARKAVSARFLLVHGLAHALIRRLSLDSGYSSAALRERVYAGGEGTEGMAGVLIYTSTTDADGTLGGLARQGRPRRFEEVVLGALHELQWCASDPLCIEGASAVAESMNLAACHACMFAPETSCEHFNQMLDRALLIGTPGEPEVGFFSDLI
jgi:hypothetical protein